MWIWLNHKRNDARFNGGLHQIYPALHTEKAKGKSMGTQRTPTHCEDCEPQIMGYACNPNSLSERTKGCSLMTDNFTLHKMIRAHQNIQKYQKRFCQHILTLQMSHREPSHEALSSATRRTGSPDANTVEARHWARLNPQKNCEKFTKRCLDQPTSEEPTS